MATQFKLRRDTAANWTSTNPTLAQGEPGFETDTNRLKIGNGVSAWTGVDYIVPSSPWSDKSASYATVAGDKGGTIRSTGSAITITVNNVLTTQGDRIDFIQAGAGQITFAAGSGVTLSSADGNLKTAKQYAAASVIFGGSGVYYLVGNLGA